MLVAHEYGFEEVHGVEVDPFLAEIAQKRFRTLPCLRPICYDGSRMPYPNNHFSSIFSGHIIEHTQDPDFYLCECLRTLSPGGFMFLEFPTRYHHTELHTQLPSCEWMPRSLRNFVIRQLAGPLSPLRRDIKQRYASILGTDLKQVSLGGVKRMLKHHAGGVIRNCVAPVPGVVRCIIQKLL
jgi:ubiquinone/menaquinone biosynthesis C-methylase UbiE